MALHQYVLCVMRLEARVSTCVEQLEERQITIRQSLAGEIYGVAMLTGILV